MDILVNLNSLALGYLLPHVIVLVALFFELFNALEVILLLHHTVVVGLVDLVVILAQLPHGLSGLRNVLGEDVHDTFEIDQELFFLFFVFACFVGLMYFFHVVRLLLEKSFCLFNGVVQVDISSVFF